MLASSGVALKHYSWNTGWNSKEWKALTSPVFSRAIEDIKILTQASFQPRTAETEGEAENVEERLGEVCRFATLHHVMS